MKRKIKNICICVLVICIIYSSFNIFFRHSTELYLNSKNRLEIKEIINNEYKTIDIITKVRTRILLGEAEVCLYTGPILTEKLILDDGDPLINYVIDNGIDTCYKYSFLIIISIIGLIICSMKKNKKIKQI